MDPDGRGSPARPDGRRRDDGRVLAWAPGLPGTESSPEPIPETPAPAGFGELDLVVTPVSVTPPRTWRRAAWFAVGASCVVLVVLVFAAARLAGPGGADRVDAFPGLPTGGLLTPQPLGPPVQPHAVEPTQQTEPGGGATQDQAAPGDQDQAPGGAGQPQGGGSGQPREGPPKPGTTAAQPGGPGGATATTPTVSLLPSTGRPSVTADDLVATTRSFYDKLPGDVDAAWAMVGTRIKVRGYETFRRQWAEVSEVHLQSVLVDGDGSFVVATVQLVRKDGESSVERFQLVFRKTSSLLIDDILPMDQGTN